MASISSSTRPFLGPVLVTGGCGFLGYHLVGALLADPEVGPVHVLDLQTTDNTHPDANYIQGSVTDPEATLSAILERTRPSTIFHAASPSATYAPRPAFHAANVVGTQTLLRLAREKPFVCALVYTSSIDIYADPPLRRATEAHRLWPDRPVPWAGVSEYDRTKTVAHRLVLAANDPPRLRTAAIVPAHVWGVRDRQGLSLFFDTFADPRSPLFQVGAGDNVVSTVEVRNCADAHILAAKALIGPPPGKKVDGEAFNVTDGEDVNMWQDVRATCALIRGCKEEELPRIRKLPAWVVGLIVTLFKWAFLVFTMGTAEPPVVFTRNGFSWSVEDHTLDDSKAKEVLGYRPRVINRAKVLAEAVEWERERRRRVAEKKLD